MSQEGSRDHNSKYENTRRPLTTNCFVIVADVWTPIVQLANHIPALSFPFFQFLILVNPTLALMLTAPLETTLFCHFLFSIDCGQGMTIMIDYRDLHDDDEHRSFLESFGIGVNLFSHK